MTQKKSEAYRQYIRADIHKSNAELAADLNLTVDGLKYHIRLAGLTGLRRRGRATHDEYDEYVIAHYPIESAEVIAEALGVSRNTVRHIAQRLGLKHNSDYKVRHRMLPIKEHLEGQRFGRLVVQKQIGTNKHGHMRYECLCDCGNITYSTAGNLKHNKKLSCGCMPRGKQRK